MMRALQVPAGLKCGWLSGLLPFLISKIVRQPTLILEWPPHSRSNEGGTACALVSVVGLPGFGLVHDSCILLHSGSVNNLVYSGKLEENRYQVLKLSYAVLKSIRERSWDDSMRDLLQEAEAKNELSACAKEHHVHLGSQPAIGKSLNLKVCVK